MPLRLDRRRFGLASTAVGAAAALPFDARAAVSLKYGNAGNADTLSNRFWATVIDEVAARTDGALDIEMFAGTLGGEKTLIEGMALGTIDIYNGAYTGTREFDILYSPYIFRDGAHAGAVMKGALGEQASRVLTERYRARMLGVGRLGPFVLFVNDPVDGIADLRGRKIRVPQIEGCIAAVEHLGGVPTPVPFNEVYLALQQGIVDGLVTALNVAVALKFNEVVTYVVANEFGQALDKNLIAVRTWDRLSDEHRAVLAGVFEEKEATDYYQAGVDAVAADLATWEERNGDGTVLTLDQSSLEQAMAPLNERLANEVYGDGAWATIQGTQA